MRIDLDVIQQWIAPGSRVLDLGCGDGTLLDSLTRNKQVNGVGIEIDPDKFNRCIDRGLSVIEQDLDQGLGNFADASFDVVVMTQTLQAMHHPDRVLEEMLRVGRQGIVAFPNFGHWFCRFHLGLKGRMPVSGFMPYYWYNTPNIHFCTVRDFDNLCRERQIRILNRAMTNSVGQLTGLTGIAPNLFATTAIYHLSR
ncbi:MAG TPA: methionine biosynthesis protein MetW [Pseudomonadales bacterium]